MGKRFRYVFAALFALIGVAFLIQGFWFFRATELAFSLVMFGFAVYSLCSKRKTTESAAHSYQLKGDAASANPAKTLATLCRAAVVIVFCIFLYLIFSFTLGVVSFRPLYTYEHYKTNTNVIKDFFPDTIPTDADDAHFSIFMEGKRWQSVTLYFKADKEYIDEYIKKLNVIESAHITSNDYDRETHIEEYANEAYDVYYTINDNHNKAGAAVYKEQNVICFFDSSGL